MYARPVQLRHASQAVNNIVGAWPLDVRGESGGPIVEIGSRISKDEVAKRLWDG